MSGDSDDKSLKRALFAVSDAVLGAAVLLCLGVYGGAWLDGKFHTAPWLSVGLSILGAGLGLARMVMKANELDKGNAKKTDSVKTAAEGAVKSSLKDESASSPSQLPFERFGD